MSAGEPRNEDLYEIMQGSDPAAATRAFDQFLTTPGEWWKGDTPLVWARRTAERAAAKFARANWPVHQLDGTDWIANYALILLGQRAPSVKVPPGFLYRVIHNTIRWVLDGKRRDGEPWAYDPDEVLEWKVAPPTQSSALRLWRDPKFCEGVGRAINGLSEVLRPYAILNLLDGLRPVEIAASLHVDGAKARQYCRRALQGIVGRADAHDLMKLGDTRTIRRALETGAKRELSSHETCADSTEIE